MVVGKVVGTIVSTRKDPKLIGNKFLVVDIYEKFDNGNKGKILAIDSVGAGVGDLVIVTLGSAARFACDTPDMPVDATIVGIVDDEKDIRINS
ncbi:EutN/CcmL family microcompartment protein [Clostridium grantii]|uniref:Ethanolamine utilization protein EutN n=1 Tax=Clostridium grantii DSM 8605 TaxID=1121316 RepID=A0A1M5SXG5_9CLOT|nr:EutN/CcmL family microcompartment protein [Clostridium grantii]SHH43229.1 ethanolamine utilization protein EutN [Clostridium grantii DSM 8605]